MFGGENVNLLNTILGIIFLMCSVLYFFAFLFPKKLKLPGYHGDSSFLGRVIIKRLHIKSDQQKILFDRIVYIAATLGFLWMGCKIM